MTDRFHLSGRLVFGLLVIGLGVCFLLDNAGILEAGRILHWWPVVLLLVGMAKLTGIGACRSTGAGVVLLVVGTWLTLNASGMTSLSLHRYWPLLLVLLGGWIVVRSIRPSPGPKTAVDPSDRIQSFTFMAGDVRKVGSLRFTGGEATAVMGGIELDLRDSRIADGQAVLDVMAVMGGIEVKVPADWTVTGEVMPILGGFEDKTAAPAGVPAGRLVIRGLAFMGGIEVKN